MANTVIALKKSGTPSSVPSDLANGELAINYADGKLYYRAANGTIASISGNEPNYFGSVNASGTFVIADTPGDILTLIAGDNVTITGDAINDTVTISATVPPGENPKFAFDQANLAYAQANAAYDAANNAVTDFSPAFIQANTARDHANASFDQANTATTNAGGAFDQANTAITNAGKAFDQANISLFTAQTGFNQANTATTNAGKAFDQANTSRVHANTAHATANASYAFANSSHIVANAAFDKANTANITADLAFIHANAAFFKANTAVTDFSPAFIQANLSYEQANTARDHANAAFLSSNSVNTYSDGTYVKLIAPSQTIAGNLSITGSLSVAGNAYTIDTETLKISDPLIYLAGNNYTSDIVDIGFVANYVNATSQNVHTGFFRDSATKEYYVFEGYDAEPVPNHIDTAGNNFTISVLNATLRTSNIILGGANAILTIGASFNHANAAHASANAGMAIGNAAFAAASAGLLQANIAYAHANASFSKANAALPNTSGVAFAGNLNLPTGNLAVGIATPNTGARLQVYNTSGNSELWITADNGYDPTLRLTGEAGEIGNEGFSIRYDNSVGDTYFENKFGAVTSYHFLTSVVEALTIHTDGKVGVGTTNPQNILDVKGVANVSSALLVNDMNVKPTIQASYDKANAANVLAFNALPNTSGISFNGSLNFPSGSINVGSSLATIPVNLQVRASTGSAIPLRISGAIGGGTSNNTQMRFFGNGAQRDLFAIGTDVAANDGSAAFDIYDIAGGNRLRIDPTGNVLVGRTNSTVGQNVKLDVSGAVNASAVLINGTPALSNSSTITTAGALVVPGTLKSNAFIITPTNGNFEGGEIQLQGAGSYDDWSIDSYINQLRFLTNSSNNNLFIIENIGTGVVNLTVDGSVGIGTKSPAAKLDVVGSIQSTGAATFGKTSNITSTNALILGTVSKSVAGSGGQGNIAIYSDDATNQLQGVIELVTTATAGDRRLRINAIEQGVAFRNVTLAELGGNVGIGTTTASAKLEVNGIINANDFNSISDVKFKNNINTIDNGLEIIIKINPVSFNWADNGKKSYGVIAQEIESILPEIVSGDDTKRVSYMQLIAFLIAAIKELDKKIKDLQNKA